MVSGKAAEIVRQAPIHTGQMPPNIRPMCGATSFATLNPADQPNTTSNQMRLNPGSSIVGKAIGRVGTGIAKPSRKGPRSAQVTRTIATIPRFPKADRESDQRFWNFRKRYERIWAAIGVMKEAAAVLGRINRLSLRPAIAPRHYGSGTAVVRNESSRRRSSGTVAGAFIMRSRAC